MDLLIRKEDEKEHRLVEVLTREAFWNLHGPGCDEHYLVHIMRGHPDFLPELDFVAALDGNIVGNIMYAKSRLVSDKGESLQIISFGPVSVLPEFQKKGIGSALIRYSLKKAVSDRYKAVVIEGHPHNYCKHGFVGSKSLNISDSEGRYPYSLLVLELEKGCLQNRAWKYYPSNVYNLDEKESAAFDMLFPPKEKAYQPTQEEYNIASRAFVE